jgi:hypothetical protein
MEYRLGNYDCPDCGHQQAGAQLLGGGTETQIRARQNLDPTAAYKQLQVSQVAQVESQAAQVGHRARRNQREEASVDPRRGEKVICTVVLLLAAAANYYLLFWLRSGQQMLRDIGDVLWMLEQFNLQFSLLLGAALYILLSITALFLGPKFLKALMAFVSAGLALGIIVGIVGPFNVEHICLSAVGFGIMLPAAWVLALLARDLSGDVV